MLGYIEKLLSNKYGAIAFAFAALGGMVADAAGGGSRFYVIFVFTAFILFFGYLDERNKSKLYKDDTVPIPVVISIDDNTSTMILLELLLSEIEKSDEKFINHQQNLEKYFNITHNMLKFKYDGSMYDKDRIISFFQIIRYELNDIQNRLKGKAQFHVYYLKRPAFGVVLGSMFARDGIVVYQTNDSKNNIERIATIKSRQYKEKIDTYEHFEVIENINDKENRDLLLVIQISSHSVSLDNETFKYFKNTILLKRKGNGTIPTDEKNVDADIWIEHAQEVYNVINKVQGKYKSITIAHSMPEAFAIILGMGLENYWNITMTQYDSGGYKNIINLNQVKYYF